ncbi:MAG: hypothetical protein R2771_05515 [Saprospiraceae bacterium]
MVRYIFSRFEKLENVHLLARNNDDRLGVFSFYINGLHHDLGVKIFNDRFGIQMRSEHFLCRAYGHYLFCI